MGHKFLGLVALFIVLFVLFNEMKNISYFIYKYIYIKDLYDIEKQNCDELYAEAETARFQIAKNMYDMILPNDIYNSKTYIILITIFSIFFYMYVCYKYIHYLNEEKFLLTSIISTVIIIHALLYIILNIVFRYVPYDEAGYINYFLGRNDIGNAKMFNNLMLFYLFICMMCFIIYNVFKKSEDFGFHHIWVYIMYFFYYAFGIWLMFNMINIVESFKINKTSYDIEPIDKNRTADISYENENGFYNKYFDLKEIPRGFFINPNIAFLTEDNYSYGVDRIYANKIEQIALWLFVFIIFFIIFVVVWKVTENNIDNKKMQNVVYMALPILYLFLLLTIIINYMKFNTMFNKDVLYAINSVYKHDINDLNNVITPYISLYNNYTSLHKQRNYIYNYVTFNVLMSYLEGHINIFTNMSTNKEIETNGKYYTFDKLTKKYIKFQHIDINDINNDEKFQKYYNDRFENMFKKKMNRKDIIETEKFYLHHFKDISYADMFDTTADIKNVKKYNLKTNIKNTIKRNIKNNIYKMFSICDIDSFNNNLKIYNNDDEDNDKSKKVVLNIFKNIHIFVSEEDLKQKSCYIYKFLIKYPLDNIGYESLRRQYENMYQNENNSCSSSTYNFDRKLDILIDNFLAYIESLYIDYEAYNTEVRRFALLSDSQKQSERGKSEKLLDTIFDSSLMVFNILKKSNYMAKNDDKVYNSDTDCYKGKSLYFLYTNILDNVNIYLESNNNYLKNVIENVFFKVNDTQSRVVLYDFNSAKYKTNLITQEKKQPKYLNVINELNLFQKELNEDTLHKDSKIMYINPVKNDLINNDLILDKANSVITQEFFSIYIINMFLIGIIFLMIIHT